MNTKLKTNHKNGFTLAEVLVTLAVVGIVLSLSIPALVQISHKRKYEAGLKKVTTTLAQAYGFIVSNYGSLESQISGDNGLRDLFGEYMSFIKTCDSGGGGPYPECFPESGKLLQGETLVFAGGAGAIGVDGTLYIFNIQDVGCDDHRYQVDGVNLACGYIRADLNGFEGPNTMGRDIFQFRVTKIGIIPGGADNEEDSNWNTRCNPDSSSIENGQGCAARVLQRGMDY